MTVLVSAACVVGFNKLGNTPITLLMLLLVNDMSQFCFDFIAAVNSSSTFVAGLAAVGTQTTALLVTHWISYGHPARIKRAGDLFEFHLSITLAVI